MCNPPPEVLAPCCWIITISAGPLTNPETVPAAPLVPSSPRVPGGLSPYNASLRPWENPNWMAVIGAMLAALTTVPR